MELDRRSVPQTGSVPWFQHFAIVLTEHPLCLFVTEPALTYEFNSGWGFVLTHLQPFS